jgi:sulfur-carrier protein
MPTLRFTPQLSRFTPVPEVSSAATDLRAALEDAFALNPALRGYVLDEQGDLRPHVFAFVDGRRCSGPDPLATPLALDSQVWVLQALTGG